MTFRQRVGPPASLPEGDVVREPGHRHPRGSSKPTTGVAAGSAPASDPPGGKSWAGRLVGTCVLPDVSVCGMCRVSGGACMIYGVYVSMCVCVHTSASTR